MKRIISALLTVAMLVTLLVVPTMTVSAATITNSADLFNTTLPQLYAVKGTPTVDGTMDAAWADAYTLRIDYSHNLLRTPSKGVQSVFIDLYMMWDENNLYILEDRQYDFVKYKAGTLNFWSGDNGNCYLISLPTAYTDDGVANDGASNMVYTHVGNATTDTPVAQGYVTKQVKYYKDNTGATTTVGYANESKVTTYTALTETGFLMETAISWDALDDYCNNFAAAADMTIGLGMYYVIGWYSNNGNMGTYGDATGLQPVKLLGEGVENPTADPIKPDFSWYDANEDVYEIWDAADLLGAVEISHMHGSATLKSAIGVANTNFTGKTLKIMADIDLNPGTTFNADGTYTGATPQIGWHCLQDFKGTIDGQGHTISGMYLPNGASYGQGGERRYNALVGRGGAGLVIRDLSLTNGYINAPKYENNGTKNTSAASFLAVAHHYNGAGTITLQNLYSDLHLSGMEFSGGIVGSTWYDNTLTWDVDNCVFTGTVQNGTKGTLMGRDTAHAAKNSGSINNCYVPVDTTAIASHKDSITLGGDAAYIQETAVAEGKFDVRILGLIDEAELGLDSVGMKVTVTYTNAETDPAVVTTYDVKTLDGVTSVYKTVNANGTPVDVSALEGEYDYAYGAVLTGVPAAATDTVTIDVVLTRVIDGVAVESVCTYTATYVGGALQ